MYRKVALVCFVLLSVAWAQTTISPTVATTRRPSQIATGIQNAINNLSNSIKGGIGMVNTTAQLTGRLTTEAVSGFTGAGQQITNSVAGIKSAALQGGVDIFKQGVDIGTNLAAVMPGVNSVASLSGGMMKAGGDLANMMGQTAISAGQGIVNGKMSLINGAVKTGTGLATGGVSTGTDMAMRGVEMGANMASSAVGTAGALINSAVNSINQATMGVSSMATNVANRVSVTARNSPTSFQAAASNSG